MKFWNLPYKENREIEEVVYECLRFLVWLASYLETCPRGYLDFYSSDQESVPQLRECMTHALHEAVFKIILVFFV